jgi:hypothetical protein
LWATQRIEDLQVHFDTRKNGLIWGGFAFMLEMAALEYVLNFRINE